MKIRKTIAPGDEVFVRWQGEYKFKVIDRHNCKSLIPHWRCMVWIESKYEHWIVPQIHMSTNDITVLTKEPNRKQLSLFN